MFLTQDDSHYETSSDIRGQMKVLERIDHFSANRRQEKEKERIMRAAKSRSKQDDPELAKMKEQAKQVRTNCITCMCSIVYMCLLVF